jgi:glucan phosphoethanolaminetransferase (alkaline phosphatase superfamily)
MSTFNGLPAHILLNHFIVVLGPLTAILAILCALWPAARRRLIWLVVLLAVGTLVLTPLTTTAGVWLSARVGPATPVLTNHEQLGSTLIWVIAALVAAVIVLAAVHVRQERGLGATITLQAVVAALVIAAAVATLVQTYRVGDSGARAAWGNVTSSAP